MADNPGQNEFDSFANSVEKLNAILAALAQKLGLVASVTGKSEAATDAATQAYVQQRASVFNLNRLLDEQREKIINTSKSVDSLADQYKNFSNVQKLMIDAIVNTNKAIDGDLVNAYKSWVRAGLDADKQLEKTKNMLKAYEWQAKSTGEKLKELGKYSHQTFGSWKTEVAAVAGITISLDALKDTLLGFNRTMFESSRTAARYGESVVSMESKFKQIQGTTEFSRQGFAKLNSMFKELYTGIPPSTKAVAEFAEAMRGRLGYSEDVIIEKTQKLLALQGKFPEVFDRIKSVQAAYNSSLGEGESQAGQYALRLKVMGASMSDIQTVMDAMQPPTAALDKFTNFDQKMAKASQRVKDAQLNISQNLQPTIEALTGAMSKLAEAIGNAGSGFHNFVAWTSVGLVSMDAVARIVETMKGMPGVTGMGGVLARGAGGAGGMIPGATKVMGAAEEAVATTAGQALGTAFTTQTVQLGFAKSAAQTFSQGISKAVPGWAASFARYLPVVGAGVIGAVGAVVAFEITRRTVSSIGKMYGEKTSPHRTAAQIGFGAYVGGAALSTGLVGASIGSGLGPFGTAAGFGIGASAGAIAAALVSMGALKLVGAETDQHMEARTLQAKMDIQKTAAMASSVRMSLAEYEQSHKDASGQPIKLRGSLSQNFASAIETQARTTDPNDLSGRGGKTWWHAWRGSGHSAIADVKADMLESLQYRGGDNIDQRAAKEKTLVDLVNRGLLTRKQLEKEIGIDKEKEDVRDKKISAFLDKANLAEKGRLTTTIQSLAALDRITKELQNQIGLYDRMIAASSKVVDLSLAGNVSGQVGKDAARTQYEAEAAKLEALKKLQAATVATVYTALKGGEKNKPGTVDILETPGFRNIDDVSKNQYRKQAKELDDESKQLRLAQMEQARLDAQPLAKEGSERDKQKKEIEDQKAKVEALKQVIKDGQNDLSNFLATRPELADLLVNSQGDQAKYINQQMATITNDIAEQESKLRELRSKPQDAKNTKEQEETLHRISDLTEKIKDIEAGRTALTEANAATVVQLSQTMKARLADVTNEDRNRLAINERMVSLAQQQVQIQEAAQTGMGNSFQALKGVVSLMYQQLNYEKSIVAEDQKVLDALQKEQENDPDKSSARALQYDQARRALSEQMTADQLKIGQTQLEILNKTKTAREGWLDAMNEFAVGAGEFGALIATKDMAVTQILRQGGPNTFARGALGERSGPPGQAPSVKFGVGGMDVNNNMPITKFIEKFDWLDSMQNEARGTNIALTALTQSGGQAAKALDVINEAFLRGKTGLYNSDAYSHVGKSGAYMGALPNGAGITGNPLGGIPTAYDPRARISGPPLGSGVNEILPILSLLQSFQATTPISGGTIVGGSGVAVPALAGGGSFYTKGPMKMVVGDNPGGVERVTVTPISGFGKTRRIPGGMAFAGGTGDDGNTDTWSAGPMDSQHFNGGIKPLNQLGLAVSSPEVARYSLALSNAGDNDLHGKVGLDTHAPDLPTGPGMNQPLPVVRPLSPLEPNPDFSKSMNWEYDTVQSRIKQQNQAADDAYNKRMQANSDRVAAADKARDNRLAAAADRANTFSLMNPPNPQRDAAQATAIHAEWAKAKAKEEANNSSRSGAGPVYKDYSYTNTSHGRQSAFSYSDKNSSQILSDQATSARNINRHNQHRSERKYASELAKAEHLRQAAESKRSEKKFGSAPVNGTAPVHFINTEHARHRHALQARQSAEQAASLPTSSGEVIKAPNSPALDKQFDIIRNEQLKRQVSQFINPEIAALTSASSLNAPEFQRLPSFASQQAIQVGNKTTKNEFSLHPDLKSLIVLNNANTDSSANGGGP